MNVHPYRWPCLFLLALVGFIVAMEKETSTTNSKRRKVYFWWLLVMWVLLILDATMIIKPWDRL